MHASILTDCELISGYTVLTGSVGRLFFFLTLLTDWPYFTPSTCLESVEFQNSLTLVKQRLIATLTRVS